MSLILKLKKWMRWSGLCQRLCEAVVLVFNLKFCSIDYFYFILYGSISLLMVYNMTPALPASVSFFFKIRKVNFAAIYIIAANF